MPPAFRRDVRLLGELLGQVLEEYKPGLLDDVERLRYLVIAARSGEADTAEAAALVNSWPLDRAELVARAFTVYFHLVNLAEEHQRIRALAEREQHGAPMRESLAETVARIRGDQGEERLRELLGGLELLPVLTAHPTEARRRAVVTAIQRVSWLLYRLDDPRRSATAEQEDRRRLLEEIDVLWRTAQLRRTRLDPLDEIRTAMAVFDETLFRVVPMIYRGLDAALEGEEGTGRSPPSAPAFLRFGSWIGGDRDGNPRVTAQTTREAMAIQADHVLRALEAATTRVGRALTTHSSTTPPTDALRRALGAAEAAHPRLLASIAQRSPDEPHRQLLLYAAERVQATRLRDADLAYRRAGELLGDLRCVQDSLAAGGAPRLAYGELQHLVWQVETFGFHLAELEIRQHSAVHERALDEVRGGGELSAETEEVLATLRVVALLQNRFGVEACRRYVVSFTRGADDIAAVYELAEYAAPSGEAPVLDVVPLFESGDDLANAPAVLDEMLELVPVRRRLDQTGRRLEVMLGYSDSAKELGPATAMLTLYDAQAELAGWARRRDVRLTLFHGRGGALGRGGGPANRAVLAQAPGSVAGRLKVTEQGEVIFARYGHEAIARRHLEQVSSAVLLASSPAVEQRSADATERFRELAERVSDGARAEYRSLVETAGFAEWFARVSPLEEIGRLGLGSRPARRHARTPDLGDLRAIPWVFAWAQTRLNLPGWYGLGTGLSTIEGLDELRRAYAEWPLLAVMLDNAEMSLAKTDRHIAERYLSLGDRPDLTEKVLAEYDRTAELVLAVTGHTRLLENRNVLSRAVELRDPYVDALSHLQLRALQALRAGEADAGRSTGAGVASEGDGATREGQGVEEPEERGQLEDLLQLTVNGVAAGLQNTG